MDALASLFAHVAPTARTFFAGNLCTASDYHGDGHLHLLRGGTLTLSSAGAAEIELTKPTLIFFPRGKTHRFIPDPVAGADLVCANVDLGNSRGNPIGVGLPEIILIEIEQHSELAAICRVLVAEAFGQDHGRQAAMDHLFDYLLILIFRHILATGLVEGGVLAGLADPKLVHAMTAIHEAPGRAWTLQDLAEVAGMSRTRFALHFRDVVGTPAIEYLANWRIISAQAQLRQGRPIKSVIRAVGYESASAFTRRFVKLMGMTPRDWLSQVKTPRLPSPRQD